VIAGERGSGVIGTAAHPGDVVTLVAYGLLDSAQAAVFEPRVVYVDEVNRIVDRAAPSTEDTVDESAAETRDAAMLDALLQPES
jgi:aspartate 1-decarboxylase